MESYPRNCLYCALPLVNHRISKQYFRRYDARDSPIFVQHEISFTYLVQPAVHVFTSII